MTKIHILIHCNSMIYHCFYGSGYFKGIPLDNAPFCSLIHGKLRCPVWKIEEEPLERTGGDGEIGINSYGSSGVCAGACCIS